jgi:hypothetical protein
MRPADVVGAEPAARWEARSSAFRYAEIIAIGAIAAARMASESMRHERLVWNPSTQEWFCTKCGRTSGHASEQDARSELEKRLCHVPSVETPRAARNPPGE